MKVITIIAAFLLVISASDSVAQQCPSGKGNPTGCRSGDCGNICAHQGRQCCRFQCIGPSSEYCCCERCRTRCPNIVFSPRNVRRLKRSTESTESTLSTTVGVNEDIGSIHICGIATYNGTDADNATVVVIIGTQSDIATTSDYDPSMVPNQALFNLSTNEQCFDVPIIDDDIPEDTENFMLSFDLLIDAEEQSPLAIVTPKMLEVEITDNDGGSSAGKVNAGVLIFFMTVLGWFLNHAHV